VQVTAAASAATPDTRSHSAHSHTHAQTDRQTDRQTYTQTKRQAGRRAGRQADRQRWTETVQPRDPSPFRAWQQ